MAESPRGKHTDQNIRVQVAQEREPSLRASKESQVGGVHAYSVIPLEHTDPPASSSQGHVRALVYALRGGAAVSKTLIAYSAQYQGQLAVTVSCWGQRRGGRSQPLTALPRPCRLTEPSMRVIVCGCIEQINSKQRYNHNSVKRSEETAGRGRQVGALKKKSSERCPQHAT